MAVKLSDLRKIDRDRMKAQVDLLNRITRGGTIDPDLAVKERLQLADRIEGKRLAFIKWMKFEGYRDERRKREIQRFDEVIRELRNDPAKMPDMGGLRSLLGGA